MQKELFGRMLIKLEAQNRIISLNLEDSKVLGTLFHSLRTMGNPIPIIDAIIGSIGLSRNLKVITTDKNHFEIIKKVENDFEVEFW